MGFLSDILGKGWEGAKWLFDSSPLKPVSEAIRQNPEVFRTTAPGFKQAEQIFGSISGAGALAGMGMNLDPRDPDKFRELPENWREILGEEVEEGFPTALETIAPIDIITAGLGGAASAIPKGIKGASSLAKAAKVADVSEGLYGVENVAEGALTGDLARAGAGVARMAGGLGGLIGVNKGKIDNLEDVVEFGDTSVVNAQPDIINEPPANLLEQPIEVPEINQAPIKFQRKPPVEKRDILEQEIDDILGVEGFKLAPEYQGIDEGTKAALRELSTEDLRADIESLGYKPGDKFIDRFDREYVEYGNQILKEREGREASILPFEKKEASPLGKDIDLEALMAPEKAKIAEADVFNTRFQNMASGFFDRIKSEAARVFGDPSVADIQVNVKPIEGESAAFFDTNSNSMTLDPAKLMERSPEEITKTILHEIAHKKEVHEFGGVVPEDVTETGGTEKGIFDLGAGKVAETDPSITEHEWPNMRARGAVSPIESQVVTAQESLFNNPDILEQAALFEQNLGKLRGERSLGGIPPETTAPVKSYSSIKKQKFTGVTSAPKKIRFYETESGTWTRNPTKGRYFDTDEFSRAGQLGKQGEEVSVGFEEGELPEGFIDSAKTPVTKELLQKWDTEGTLDDNAYRLLQEGDREGAAAVRDYNVNKLSKPTDISSAPKDTPKSISQPADLLRKVLTETKLTKFNKSNLIETLENKGIPVPEEVKNSIPELLAELKERGWVNEKVGGTYTLQIEPPKRVTEIASGKIPKGEEEVIDIEEALKQSLEKVEGPRDTATDKALSTMSDASLARLSKTISKEGPYRADLDAEIARRAKKTSPLTARQKRTVAGTEPPMSEKRMGEKTRQEDYVHEQIQFEGKKTPNLKETMKEKLTEKELGALSKLFGKTEGGKKVLTEVQEAQEAAIRASSKKLTPKVKPTTTTEEFVPVAESSGKPPGKPPKKPSTPKEEPKFGREAITPEDTFTQAWKKLTPTQMVSEVGAIIKSMRGSLDLPMLRQGKIMTVDFLTTGNARELSNALKQSKDVTFGKKTMDTINAEHAADPITSRLVSDFGLDLPGIAGHLKEEAFHSGTAEKIPLGVGKVIKKSNDVYTVFLNEARVSEAKRLVKIADDAGFSMDDNPDVYKSLMKAVNIVGSRGDFKKIGPALNELSNYMWAPRLKVSRGQLLTSAAGLGEMHPFARAELRKSLGRTTAVNMSLLGLAALAGAQVETDPRNSDWGKIRVGETRIDPWFGLQPMVRATVLAYTGERVSATTGTKRDVSIKDLVGEQITSGAAPGITYPYEMLTGKSLSGYPIDRGERAILGVSPLIVEDIYDAFKEYGLIGAGVGGPAFLGESVNTFGKKKKNKKSGNGYRVPKF